MPRSKTSDDKIYETFRIVNQEKLTYQKAVEKVGFGYKTFFNHVRDANTDDLIRNLIEYGIPTEDAKQMVSDRKAGKAVRSKKERANLTNAPIKQDDQQELTKAKDDELEKALISLLQKSNIQQVILTFLKPKIPTSLEIKQINDGNKRLYEENRYLRLTLYKFMMLFLKISKEEPDNGFNQTMADKFQSAIIGLLETLNTNEIEVVFSDDLYPCFLFTDDNKDINKGTVFYDRVKKFRTRMKKECPDLYDTIFKKVSQL